MAEQLCLFRVTIIHRTQEYSDSGLVREIQRTYAYTCFQTLTLLILKQDGVVAGENSFLLMCFNPNIKSITKMPSLPDGCVYVCNEEAV